MHQSRQFADWKLPIERKGNKYVVRASSHVRDSVPVLMAIRDMLKIARDAREVKEMIKAKEKAAVKALKAAEIAEETQ